MPCSSPFWKLSLSCPPPSRELSQCFADVFLGCLSRRGTGEMHALPALGFPIRKMNSRQNSSPNSEDKKGKGERKTLGPGDQ